MADSKKYSDQTLPILRLTLILMWVNSVIFPSIFAYINRETSFLSLLSDIIITAAIETITTIFTFYCIRGTGILFSSTGANWIKYPLSLLITLVFSFFLLYTFYNSTRQVTSSPQELLQTAPFRLYITVNLIGTLFIYAMITSLTLYQSILVQTLETEQFQKDYAQVRLQALKSQVNPHFLFNSLSVLTSLVHTDPDLSEKFIVQLSKAYRYILDQKETDLVTLKKETDFLENYFFLLQIRFQDKISLHIDPKAKTENWLIPPLTLQLLIENAVKHNRMSVAKPLDIHLSLNQDRIEVSNSINAREQHEPSTGIGLDNIRKRIAFSNSQPLTIETTNNIFKVTVPLTRNKII
ncbi:histidine kinase [Flavihumibacter rivuli]|uniref:sensor histidine kinase n=1 Tax=Flavihumibacter rivuli TaxID=2838156 RepID=UPI001BDE323C|nr:histidine kinase [Flavihumibacter rivuli]ULQ58234.1 histidine kinase [Flavihumibacter rivuli]